MNVKFHLLIVGILFFGEQNVFGQKVKKDTISTRNIDEVVVTGYTTKKKENLTTSIATVGAKQINDIPIASFEQILAGKASGVSVGTGSGQPGTTSRIVIRGIGSINGGTTPLYIVDGVPVNANVFASLNPNDFEDISILKDAAAKSLYGSQAGNGVILVKTKSGRRNGRFTVNYSGNIGASLLPQAKFNMMDTKTLLGIQKDLGFWDLSNPADIAKYNRLIEINTNWEDVFLKEVLTYQNDLSFTGGAQNTDYRFSLGYLNQDGIIKNSGLQRFTSNLSLNSGNGTNFRFGVNAIFGYSKKNGVNSEGGLYLANPIAAAYYALPYQSLYKPDGTFDVGPGKYAANAYQLLTTQQRLTQEFKAIAGVYTEYDFTNTLTIAWRGNIDHTGQFYKEFTDPNSFFGSTTNPGNSGSLSRLYYQYIGLNSNLLLKYSNNFGDHKISGYIGSEYTGKFLDGFRFIGYGLNNFLENAVNNIQITKDLLPKISGTERSLHILSYMTSVDYSYKGKYLLSANARRDGASFFSTSYKWGTFGGMSGAWYISKEDFFTSNHVLSDLKLRVSWGKLGNTGDLFAVAAYNDKKYLELKQYDGQYTFNPSGPLNTTYRWESESQYDIGLDFGLWKNKITGTVDYYDRLTNNLYINKSLSYSSGFSRLARFNGGKMRNRGIEVAITIDVISKSDLKLNFNANYAYNRNRIEDLGEVSEYILGTSIVRVGLPYGSHYVVKWGGVDPATGAPIYLDRNNQRMDQFSGSQSQATFGSSMPPHTGGFGLNFNYKGFFVEPQFQFKTGFYRFNNMRFFNEDVRKITSYNQYNVVSTYWKTPGQITDIQGYRYPLEFTSKFIEDSSFLRLRNIRIGYVFPKQILGDFGLSHATIYLNATNLFTWTKWTGLDPDDSNNLASYEYPSPRIVTIGVNLTF